MVFNHMFVLPNHNPPARFFLRTPGACVYATQAEDRVNAAADYVRQVLKAEQKAFEGYEFLLGAVWGDMDSHEKVLDVFGFPAEGDWRSGDGSWRRGNPVASVYVFRNGVLSRGIPRIHAETLRLIGEDLHLRSSNAGGLPGYIGMQPPQIRDVIENPRIIVLD